MEDRKYSRERSHSKDRDHKHRDRSRDRKHRSRSHDKKDRDRSRDRKHRDRSHDRKSRDHSHDRKGRDREERRDAKYDRKYERFDDRKEERKDDYRDDRRDNRETSNLFKRDDNYQYQGFSKSLVIDAKDSVKIEKSFYRESDSVRKRTSEDIRAFRESARISIKSDYAPNPITTFEESGFPSYILDVFKQKGYQKPTAIQSQGWPIVLKGHDLIGIAQTGSGKTIGFILPGIVHMKAQEPLRRGDGPIALVLAPTRELAMQIYEEFKPFGNAARLRATCIYGGADKFPQKRDLRSGCELVIATPGRLIDFLESGDTNLKRVSYLVIDEADRMLDMGFIPQIEKIVQYIRSDRQTLMWSATWPKEVRKLAEDLCKEKPIHIVVGNDDLAVNKAVTQLVKVVSPKAKFDTLLRLIRGIYDGSKILIFCQTKKTSDWVSRTLQNENYRSVAIHGDKSQKDRDKIMSLFKDQRVPILVATNLAARGLDVKDIRFVVNYDFPTQMEEYVHRVGRTGRAGATGTSFTLFTQEDGRFAKDLIKVLVDNNQKVPDELYDLVSDRRFKEKMMRFDKSHLNRDAKNFSDYEKEGHSRSGHMIIEPHSHNRGAIHRTVHPTSRPPYPQSFHSSGPSHTTAPPTSNIPVTRIGGDYNPYGQTQGGLTAQQQYMMAQIQMMQMMQQQQGQGQGQGQYPTGQMNPYGMQPGQYPPPNMPMSVPTGDPNAMKKDDDKSGETMQQPGGNQFNGNSYYRDIYSSHGNSYYNQQVDTQGGNGMTNPTYVKRQPGTSRFSDLKPSEPNTAGKSVSDEYKSFFEENKTGGSTQGNGVNPSNGQHQSKPDDGY
eukprot:CAMPEP_0176437136 /NCGR_PEP_ID=MMETSP0127-20121128/18426_1 /TAXON_ID=938130 /ORGANISM="Platyophrya macrostoma, Strain WH" /LENGTH=832 /DNA_ID=CAMNT_0017820673 /DNA_START=6 /DNA_END=2504 /DNA_ORIENTATION=-